MQYILCGVWKQWGSMPRHSGPWRKKVMKSPLRLSLGTITQHPFMEGLILLPKYGLGVQVQFGKVLGTHDCPTLGSASTHCVLRLNLIKGMFNIVSILTHTLTCIQQSNMAFSSQNPSIHLSHHSQGSKHTHIIISRQKHRHGKINQTCDYI